MAGTLNKLVIVADTAARLNLTADDVSSVNSIDATSPDILGGGQILMI